MPRIISSSCHVSRAPCRLILTARLPGCSLHCPHPFHPHFPALAQRCFNQELAPIHTALEVTVSRNPILLQVMSPKWLATRRLSTSSTRSSLNERVLTRPKMRSTTLLKRFKFRKLRISSPYHTTRHYCLRPWNLWKALPRRKRQTWLTNKFAF